MPTLILHGKRDKSAPYTFAEEMHARIQGSCLVPFEGGHLFFLFRERQAFLNAVAAHLDRVHEGNE
jgi:pimeloyl-ACP methyl ester carboxylesterase